MVIQIFVRSSVVFIPRVKNINNSFEAHGCSCLLSTSLTRGRACMQSKLKPSQWEMQCLGATLFSNSACDCIQG